MLKFEEFQLKEEIAMKALKEGMTACGCLLLIPSFNISFLGALAIYMIIMSVKETL